MDAVLDARVERAADPMNLIPTASTTVALAWGDALAAALVQARKFGHQDFAKFHPAGQLGRSLLVHVGQVMHPAEAVALVVSSAPLRDVIIAMTQHPLGAACVVSEERQELLGLITDGDVRRALLLHEDIRVLCAADCMTRAPVCVEPDATLQTAANLMENRASQISVLPVVDHSSNRCVGLVRMHDIFDNKKS